MNNSQQPLHRIDEDEETDDIYASLLEGLDHLPVSSSSSASSTSNVVQPLQPSSSTTPVLPSMGGEHTVVVVTDKSRTVINRSQPSSPLRPLRNASHNNLPSSPLRGTKTTNTLTTTTGSLLPKASHLPHNPFPSTSTTQQSAASPSRTVTNHSSIPTITTAITASPARSLRTGRGKGVRVVTINDETTHSSSSSAVGVTTKLSPEHEKRSLHDEEDEKSITASSTTGGGTTVSGRKHTDTLPSITSDSAYYDEENDDEFSDFSDRDSDEIGSSDDDDSNEEDEDVELGPISHNEISGLLADAALIEQGLFPTDLDPDWFEKNSVHNDNMSLMSFGRNSLRSSRSRLSHSSLRVGEISSSLNDDNFSTLSGYVHKQKHQLIARHSSDNSTVSVIPPVAPYTNISSSSHANPLHSPSRASVSSSLWSGKNHNNSHNNQRRKGTVTNLSMVASTDTVLSTLPTELNGASSTTQQPNNLRNLPQLFLASVPDTSSSSSTTDAVPTNDTYHISEWPGTTNGFRVKVQMNQQGTVSHPTLITLPDTSSLRSIGSTVEPLSHGLHPIDGDLYPPTPAEWGNESIPSNGTLTGNGGGNRRRGLSERTQRRRIRALIEAAARYGVYLAVRPDPLDYDIVKDTQKTLKEVGGSIIDIPLIGSIVVRMDTDLPQMSLCKSQILRLATMHPDEGDALIILGLGKLGTENNSGSSSNRIPDKDITGTRTMDENMEDEPSEDNVSVDHDKESSQNDSDDNEQKRIPSRIKVKNSIKDTVGNKRIVKDDASVEPNKKKLRKAVSFEGVSVLSPPKPTEVTESFIGDIDALQELLRHRPWLQNTGEHEEYDYNGRNTLPSLIARGNNSTIPYHPMNRSHGGLSLGIELSRIDPATEKELILMAMKVPDLPKIIRWERKASPIHFLTHSRLSAILRPSPFSLSWKPDLPIELLSSETKSASSSSISTELSNHVSNIVPSSSSFSSSLPSSTNVEYPSIADALMVLHPNSSRITDGLPVSPAHYAFINSAQYITLLTQTQQYVALLLSLFVRLSDPHNPVVNSPLVARVRSMILELVSLRQAAEQLRSGDEEINGITDEGNNFNTATDENSTHHPYPHSSVSSSTSSSSGIDSKTNNSTSTYLQVPLVPVPPPSLRNGRVTRHALQLARAAYTIYGPWALTSVPTAAARFVAPSVFQVPILADTHTGRIISMVVAWPLVLQKYNGMNKSVTKRRSKKSEIKIVRSKELDEYTSSSIIPIISGNSMNMNSSNPTTNTSGIHTNNTILTEEDRSIPSLLDMERETSTTTSTAGLDELEQLLQAYLAGENEVLPPSSLSSKATIPESIHDLNSSPSYVMNRNLPNVSSSTTSIPKEPYNGKCNYSTRRTIDDVIVISEDNDPRTYRDALLKGIELISKICKIPKIAVSTKARVSRHSLTKSSTGDTDEITIEETTLSNNSSPSYSSASTTSGLFISDEDVLLALGLIKYTRTDLNAIHTFLLPNRKETSLFNRIRNLVSRSSTLTNRMKKEPVLVPPSIIPSAMDVMESPTRNVQAMLMEGSHTLLTLAQSVSASSSSSSLNNEATILSHSTNGCTANSSSTDGKIHSSVSYVADAIEILQNDLLDFTLAERRLLTDAVAVYQDNWSFISAALLPFRGPALLQHLYSKYIMPRMLENKLEATLLYGNTLNENTGLTESLNKLSSVNVSNSGWMNSNNSVTNPSSISTAMDTGTVLYSSSFTMAHYSFQKLFPEIALYVGTGSYRLGSNPLVSGIYPSHSPHPPQPTVVNRREGISSVSSSASSSSSVIGGVTEAIENMRSDNPTPVTYTISIDPEHTLLNHHLQGLPLSYLQPLLVQASSSSLPGFRSQTTETTTIATGENPNYNYYVPSLHTPWGIPPIVGTMMDISSFLHNHQEVHRTIVETNPSPPRRRPLFIATLSNSTVPPSSTALSTTGTVTVSNFTVSSNSTALAGTLLNESTNEVAWWNSFLNNHPMVEHLGDKGKNA